MMIMYQTAYLLPASSIFGALVHSQSTIVSQKYLYIGALATMVAAVLMMLLVGIPVSGLLF